MSAYTDKSSGTGNIGPFSCTPNLPRVPQSAFPRLHHRKIEDVLEEKWALYESAANDCLAYEAETGRLMSTVFMARDMYQIVEALGEDGLLRYWGKDNPSVRLPADKLRELLRYCPWDDLCCNLPGARRSNDA